MKYLGILISVVGAIILIASFFVATYKTNNTYLIAGIVLVITGFLSHIFINKNIAK